MPVAHSLKPGIGVGGAGGAGNLLCAAAAFPKAVYVPAPTEKLQGGQGGSRNNGGLMRVTALSGRMRVAKTNCPHVV